MVLKANKTIRPALICLFSVMCLFVWAGCEDPAGQKTVARENPAHSEKSPDRIIVHLYFSDSDNSFLISEERSLSARIRPELLGFQIINALLEGPQKALERTIPEGTLLRGFYILQDRTACVDLSREIREHHPGGAKSELMTIYSIVNSLILNIPEIETVRILVEGKEEATLAGHVDLRFPFQANMLFVR
ncbi:MAG: GerMN domain-containing protein [Desulfobacterales bacterium]|nr:GerMN domain-containing protein [Desulfobacterales bacterium]MDX2512079.1 GerMN domain-containing protein [Desulfobacterales bacterium]